MTDSPPAPAGIDDFLCFSIYAAGHAFTRFYKPLLDELGLTYPQYLVLVALGERNGQTVGEVGERLFLESSTLTPLLKRLETAGHVRRTRAQKDERQVHVHLTDSGRALLARAQSIPGCVFHALQSTPEALRALKTSVDALRTALTEPTSRRSIGELGARSIV